MVIEKEDAIELLREMKNTNVSYKEIAEALNIKVSSIYTWMSKGNIGAGKAAYVVNGIRRHFPEAYTYAAIVSGLRLVEKQLREAKEAGAEFL